MFKWILHQNLNNHLIFKFFCILSWNIFLPLSIPDEAAATGYCSNYLGYWVFDVDFGDNYMLYQRISERNASLFYEIWVRTGLSRFLGQHWELQQGPGTMLNHAFHFVIHLQPIRWCFWEAVLHRAELSMSKMRVMSTKIFRLNKRKKFLQWGSWGTRTGCPERWWMSYPWRHLRSSCIGLIELYVAGKLDQMAFKGLFQFKWLCDSVISDSWYMKIHDVDKYGKCPQRKILKTDLKYIEVRSSFIYDQRIIESPRLEKTYKIIQSNCQHITKIFPQTTSLSTTSKRFLNTYRDGDSTTSLGNLC